MSLTLRSESYVWVISMQHCDNPKLILITDGNPETVTGKQVSTLLSGIEPPVLFVNVWADKLSREKKAKKLSRIFFMSLLITS
jgi:hypothetical protein